MNTLLHDDCEVAMLLADLRSVVPVGVERRSDLQLVV